MSNDREMWKTTCGGDEAAFDAFYREHAPRLKSFLRQLVGSAEIAEDVAQEAFTQLWRRPHGYDPERGSLKNYLFGIARKRAAEWWRTQKITVEPSEGDLFDGSTESASLIGDALAHLPREQRELLWLREVEGQSYAELAMILEVPIGTVRSRLFAAREALRALWLKPRQRGVLREMR